MGVPSITVAELSADAVLVDVREQVEWDAGHIEGSQHVPMSQFVERQGEVPKEGNVVLVCTVGGRSGRVGEYLRQSGWSNVCNLRGGLDHWLQDGRPLVTDSGTPGQLVH